MNASRARRRSISAIALGISAIVAGCAGAPPAPEPTGAAASEGPPQAPSPDPESASKDVSARSPAAPASPAELAPHIEDALAELNRAELTVNELLAPSPPPDPAAPADPGPARGPLPQPARPPPRGVDRPSDTPPAVATGDRCAVACRALASMQSAARHLCALAGETDTRCHNARARVEGAQSRVRAGCPSCFEAQ